MNEFPPASGPTEAAILVGVDLPGYRAWSTEESLQELGQLAVTAGARVVGQVVQRRDAPDPAHYVGEGKAAEIEELRLQSGAGLIVFDDELSPAQLRNLERVTQGRVIDRTALILDIFAQRAHTREGKLQVELAQLNYRLPRLGGRGSELSRLGGGIGTRGPGETKLETDRRRIRRRIAELWRQIEDIKRHRRQQRRARAREWPVVALCGYTNAGKSTLLNTLTGAGVLAEDRLFATLDPTTRRVEIPSGGSVLLTDTVGFIEKLPPQLVAAFSATLEEVTEADLICHVVDASHPRRAEQEATVLRVLRKIGAQDRPVLTVYNKTDLLPAAELGLLLRQNPRAQLVSALRRQGLPSLLEALAAELAGGNEWLEVLVPYARAGLLAVIHRRGRVNRELFGPEGIEIVAELPRVWAGRIRSDLAAPGETMRRREGAREPLATGRAAGGSRVATVDNLGPEERGRPGPG